MWFVWKQHLVINNLYIKFITLGRLANTNPEFKDKDIKILRVTRD